MEESALSYFLMGWLDPSLLLLTAAGTFAGIYIGAIPGLSVTMAVSILISFTFAWDVNDALCLMVGVYMGGVVYDIYGGHQRPLDGALAQVDLAFVREDGRFRTSHDYATPEQADRLYAGWGF